MKPRPVEGGRSGAEVKGALGQGGDGPVTVTAFISSQRAEHDVSVRLACHVLGVSESWYFKHRNRPPTPRQPRRAELAAAARRLPRTSRG